MIQALKVSTSTLQGQLRAPGSSCTWRTRLSLDLRSPFNIPSSAGACTGTPALEVMKCQESPQEDFSLVTCKLFWFSKCFSWVLVEFDSFLCVCVYQLFRNCKRKQHSLCVLQIRGESTGDTLERSCFCCVFLTEGPEVLSPWSKCLNVTMYIYLSPYRTIKSKKQTHVTLWRQKTPLSLPNPKYLCPSGQALLFSVIIF